jgi:hypothetical protein
MLAHPVLARPKPESLELSNHGGGGVCVCVCVCVCVYLFLYVCMGGMCVCGGGVTGLESFGKYAAQYSTCGSAKKKVFNVVPVSILTLFSVLTQTLKPKH